MEKNEKNKRSFVLYCDVIHTLKLLSDEQSGRLFKHILSYVNDENPEEKDPLILLAFEPIKQSLKRDLEKWKLIREKRADAGSKGGKQKLANAKSDKQNVANVAVNVNDSVNVSVSDIVSDIDKRKILDHYNACFNKRASVLPKKFIEQLSILFSEGYSLNHIAQAMTNASKDKWHKEQNFEVATLFYFTRVEIIERYSSQNKNTKYIPTK